jgi:hypothetical protein
MQICHIIGQGRFGIETTNQGRLLIESSLSLKCHMRENRIRSCEYPVQQDRRSSCNRDKGMRVDSVSL